LVLAEVGFDVAVVGRAQGEIEETGNGVLSYCRKAIGIRCDVIKSKEVNKH
jgi:hypothetical protein